MFKGGGFTASFGTIVLFIFMNVVVFNFSFYGITLLSILFSLPLSAVTPAQLLHARQTQNTSHSNVRRLFPATLLLLSYQMSPLQLFPKTILSSPSF